MPWARGTPGCECCDDCKPSVCITVFSSCGGCVNGATLTLSQGGVEKRSCVTDETCQCCILDQDAGSYDYRVSAPGYADSTGTTVLSGCETTTLSVTLTRIDPLNPVCITVLGCGLTPIEGVTINLKQAGITIFTGQTDVDGRHCFPVSDFTTYTVELIHPASGCTGYADQPSAGTVSAALCGENEFTFYLEPDDDHVCCGISLASKSLDITIAGQTLTATYDDGTGFWSVCGLFSSNIVPGECGPGDITPPFSTDDVEVFIGIACLQDEIGHIIGYRVSTRWRNQYCFDHQDGGVDVVKVYNLNGGCTDPSNTDPVGDCGGDETCVHCVGQELAFVTADVLFGDMTLCPLAFAGTMPTGYTDLDNIVPCTGSHTALTWPNPAGGAFTVTDH